MRTGPVYEKAVEILSVLSDATTVCPLLFLYLKIMVVNETLELKDHFARRLPFLKQPKVILEQSFRFFFWRRRNKSTLNILHQRKNNDHHLNVCLLLKRDCGKKN